MSIGRYARAPRGFRSEGHAGTRTELPRCSPSADVVVAWTLATAAYLPAARLRRIRTVCSVHEILPGRRGALLAWLTCRTSDAIMVNSRATCAWLDRVGRPQFAPTLAYPVAPRYSPISRTTDNQLTCLLAGRVNGHKGHIEAVQAMEIVRSRGFTRGRLILLGGIFPGQQRHLDGCCDDTGQTLGGVPRRS